MQPERQPEREPERRFREVPPEGNVPEGARAMPPAGAVPAERRMQPMEEYRRGEEPGYMREPGAIRDRMRSGPVVAGLLSALGTLVVLNLLGVVFGLTSLVSPVTFGVVTLSTGAGIYAFIAFLVSTFVGGWITARSLSLIGVRHALLNAGVMWALVLTVGIFMSALGLTVFGPVLSGFTFLRLGGPIFSSTLALWILVSLLGSLATAMVGAWLGARRYREYEERREQR